MIKTNIFDMSSFKKLKTTHDGHGRISCETRTELEKYFDLEVVNKIVNIVNKLYYGDFVDLSYDEFMEVVNDQKTQSSCGCQKW